MVSFSIRMSPPVHQMLRELAEQTGTSMQAALEKAISEYHRTCFLAGLNADFAALRNNPKAWKEELHERALWDSTLSDGLEEE